MCMYVGADFFGTGTIAEGLRQVETTCCFLSIYPDNCRFDLDGVLVQFVK